jgi:hypothetical protein
MGLAATEGRAVVEWAGEVEGKACMAGVAGVAGNVSITESCGEMVYSPSNSGCGCSCFSGMVAEGGLYIAISGNKDAPSKKLGLPPVSSPKSMRGVLRKSLKGVSSSGESKLSSISGAVLGGEVRKDWLLGSAMPGDMKNETRFSRSSGAKPRGRGSADPLF